MIGGMLTRMTTEEATKELSEVWHLGCDHIARRALDRCQEYCRAWNWTAANREMEVAYRLLGAKAPSTAVNALHSGSHPVQVAATDYE